MSKCPDCGSGNVGSDCDRLSASVKIQLPLYRSGANRVRAGLGAASDTGREIGYRSGGVTSPDGTEVTIWLSLDPAQLLAAAPAIAAKAVQKLEAGLDLDQLRSELKRIAEGRMTLDDAELLTWAEGWLLTLHGGEGDPDA